ncbi:MAG TPA: DUF2971 domain-containing protein [Pirellulales bacterium]|jgi:hypothetical protein
MVVAPVDFPKRLFKYRSGTLEDIANLSNNQLWFAKVGTFNDPFDCALDVVCSEPSIETLKRMLEKQTPALVPKLDNLNDDQAAQIRIAAAGQFKESIEKKLQGFLGGVCCFSATADCLLMWGHYANGHRGFCLEFNMDRDAKLGLPPMEVDYPPDNSIPVLDTDRLMSGDLTDKELIRLWLVKSNCWAYENEWRILNKKGDVLRSYDPAALTAIYLGAKMPDDHQQVIKRLVAGTEVKVRKMTLRKGSFKLIPTDTEI